jgi:hypothetical protein
MTKARMKIAAGAIACDSVLDSAAIDRKYIDIVKVHTSVNKKKTKKCPGVLRRFVMKYSVKSNTMVVPILLGKSQSIEATASANG